MNMKSAALCFMLYALCFISAAQSAVFVAPRGTAVAAWNGDVSQTPSDYMSPSSFNTMEPFLTNEMRERLRPAGTYRAPDPAPAWSRIATGTQITPASAYARGRSDSPQFQARAHPRQGSGGQAAVSSQGGLPPVAAQQRRVVARSGTPVAIGASPAVARAAAPTQAPSVARSATGANNIGVGSARPVNTNAVGAENFPPLQTVSQGRRVVARTSRADNSTYSRNAANQAALDSVSNFSPEQCLADYTRCMNGYCQRENTLYNRCYCSPKLAQIDGQYRPAIDAALERIIIMKNGGFLPDNGMTDEELEEFWGNTFAGGEWKNSLAELSATLASIDWSNADSQVRGQNAFAIGHEYCIQHLHGCYYMAQNLRNVYRSEISRDCAIYEKILNNMKMTAESTVKQMGG